MSSTHSRGFRERLLERIAPKLSPASISLRQTNQLESYYSLLCRWNRKLNLTALPLEPLSDHALDRLFVEPLVAAKYVLDTPIRWVDLGSGGGSPAVPLKVMRESADLTMVESRSRKAAFLREVVRTLELPTAGVLAERFEAATDRQIAPASLDLVTVRAVRLSSSVVPFAERALSPGGRLMLFASPSAEPLPESQLQLEVDVPLLPDGGSQMRIYRMPLFHVERRESP